MNKFPEKAKKALISYETRQKISRQICREQIWEALLAAGRAPGRCESKRSVYANTRAF